MTLIKLWIPLWILLILTAIGPRLFGWRDSCLRSQLESIFLRCFHHCLLALKVILTKLLLVISLEVLSFEVLLLLLILIMGLVDLRSNAHLVTLRVLWIPLICIRLPLVPVKSRIINIFKLILIGILWLNILLLLLHVSMQDWWSIIILLEFALSKCSSKRLLLIIELIISHLIKLTHAPSCHLQINIWLRELFLLLSSLRIRKIISLVLVCLHCVSTL